MSGYDRGFIWADLAKLWKSLKSGDTKLGSLRDAVEYIEQEKLEAREDAVKAKSAARAKAGSKAKATSSSSSSSSSTRGNK